MMTLVRITQLIIQHNESQVDRQDVDMAPVIIDDTPHAALLQQTEADLARGADGMGAGLDSGPPVSANSNGKRPLAESRSGKQPPPAQRRPRKTGSRGRRKTKAPRQSKIDNDDDDAKSDKSNVLLAKPGDIAADFAKVLAMEVDPPEPDLPGISVCNSRDTIVRGKVWSINLSFIYHSFIPLNTFQFCSSCGDQRQNRVVCATNGCPIVVCMGKTEGTACIGKVERKGDTWVCPAHNIPCVIKVSVSTSCC
jgi:hypothetical protein